MKKCATLAMAASVVLLASPWMATSHGAQQTPKATTAKVPATRAPATKTELWIVVQIGDEMKAIKKLDLTTERKRVADEYKQSMKAYEEAKKAAGKSKDKSAELVKPAKLTIKTLKTPVLKNQEEANAWIEQHPKNGKDGGGKTGKKSPSL